jgi:ribonuclease HI
MKGKVGAGVVIRGRRRLDLSYNLPPYATVFQAEIAAILKAAEALEDVSNHGITLNVDSQAAIRTLSNPKVASKLVFQAVEALNHLGKKNTVTINWVRAHVGHDLNELADHLAKQGRHSLSKLDTPVSKAALKNAVNNWLNTRWRKWWNDTTSCRRVKQWFDGPDKQRSEHLMSLGRTELSNIIKLLTCFSNLLVHRARINTNVIDQCRLCKSHSETGWHILTECPALEWTRRQNFYSLGSPEWTVEHLVGLGDDARVVELLEVRLEVDGGPGT